MGGDGGDAVCFYVEALKVTAHFVGVLKRKSSVVLLCVDVLACLDVSVLGKEQLPACAPVQSSTCTLHISCMISAEMKLGYIYRKGQS